MKPYDSTWVTVTHVRDIPPGHHYAILHDETVSVPGWERNDPTESRSIIALRVTANHDAWVEEIKNLSLETGYNRRKPFRAFTLDPAEVTVTVNVAVEPKLKPA